MRMDNYLKQVEFAATSILHAIWHEHSDYENMNKELGELFQKTTSEYEEKQIVAHQKNNPAILYSWWNNSEELKTLFNKNNELDLLKRRIRARIFAIDALAGNLLQIAKQGISIVHGKPHNCPNGRFIGTQSLKAIIWNGRNQALHWEDSRLKPEITIFFRSLCLEHGLTHFGLFRSKSLGFAIVNILEWKTFDKFKSDMLLLNKENKISLVED